MSMKNKKVAIFTVYYNRENDILESVNSLLNQEYDDFCVVVVNDGSTDNTQEILSQLESDNLIVINKENTGFVDSIIFAINNIPSEYIAIHGSGDISLPQRIRLQANILDNDQSVGVVGCLYKTIDLVRKIESCPELPTGLISSKAMHENLLIKNPLTHGEVMIRRTMYQQVGGYNKFFLYAQDYDLWVRMSQIANFYVLDKFLYIRYIRKNGVGGSVNKLALQQLLVSIAKNSIHSGNNSYPILALVNKKKDTQLRKRLVKLSIRSLLLEKTYPITLARVNIIEFGLVGIFINMLLFPIKLKRKK